MIVTLEIPEELAGRLGPGHRQELWTEAELGRFLGLSRLALDRFLKDHGVELDYRWEDLEREREVHRNLLRS